MTPTYRISECFVLQLDAGRDPIDGSKRRVFVLGDSGTGRVLAAAPSDGGDFEPALLDLIAGFEVAEPYAVARSLASKVGERVRIAPSHRTHLLRREAQERSTPARARLE